RPHRSARRAGRPRFRTGRRDRMGIDGTGRRGGRGKGRAQVSGASVPLRVMVVDDHPIWRDGVARDLAEEGFDVVATADGAASAAARAGAVRPDVVLMDMQMPDGTGAEATAMVLRVCPGAHVLVLSASDERDDVLDAIKAGATGYLVKSAQRSELVAAVTATGGGQAVFTPGLAGLVLGEYRRIARSPDTRAPTLTPRETE